MSASSSFLCFGIRRAFFQSVKVSPRHAQNENRPVKGETMAGSANFGGISPGPADLFGLIAFSLRRTESTQAVISVTAGIEPVQSLCCGKSLLTRPSLVPILAKKSVIKFAFSVSLTARLPSSLYRLNNLYCPVTTLERYIKLGEIETTSTDYNLFRQVRFFKKKNAYNLCGKGLSYSRCREIFKDCLKGLGYDEKKFGLHSLRSGGATAAIINNPNLSERLLKLHGRWKSDIAKDMYTLEQTQNRLSVTCNLGPKVDNVIHVASLE